MPTGTLGVEMTTQLDYLHMVFTWNHSESAPATVHYFAYCIAVRITQRRVDACSLIVEIQSMTTREGKHTERKAQWLYITLNLLSFLADILANCCQKP